MGSVQPMGCWRGGVLLLLGVGAGIFVEGLVGEVDWKGGWGVLDWVGLLGVGGG